MFKIKYETLLNHNEIFFQQNFYQRFPFFHSKLISSKIIEINKNNNILFNKIYFKYIIDKKDNKLCYK